MAPRCRGQLGAGRSFSRCKSGLKLLLRATAASVPEVRILEHSEVDVPSLRSVHVFSSPHVNVIGS